MRFFYGALKTWQNRCVFCALENFHVNLLILNKICFQIFEENMWEKRGNLLILKEKQIHSKWEGIYVKSTSYS